MKVLIAGGGTGGHLIPALSLADALTTIRSDVEPVIVGAQRGVEASLLPTREPHYPYYLLPVEPVYRRQWWRNARWLRVLPKLRSECLRILDVEEPVVVVGTGGYASGPILHYAFGRGIPLAIQEQNALPGMATKLLSKRARQIHLGFAEAEHQLKVGPRTRVFCLGNPIPAPGMNGKGKEQARVALGIPAGVPVCLVMGGSQGARGINRSLAAAIDAGLLDGVVILWSTGHAHWERYGHYDAPPLRQARPFWDPISAAYEASDLVVSRAGAMSTAELCAWGLPSVLVPLPTAAADHQTVNARALGAAGAAVYLPESALHEGGEVLASQLLALLQDPERLTAMSDAARSRGRPNAAGDIAAHILTLTD